MFEMIAKADNFANNERNGLGAVDNFSILAKEG